MTRSASAPPSPTPDADEAPRFEMLVAELSVGFSGLAPEQLDAAIEAAQRSICECLGFLRSSVWQVDPDDPGDLRLTHAYQRPPERPSRAAASHRRPGEVGTLQPGTSARRTFPWVLGQVEAGELVTVADLDDMPREATADREMFRSLGYRSFAVLPLLLGRTLIGALTFVNGIPRERWDPRLIRRLDLVGRLFASSLQRRRHEFEQRRSEARLAAAVKVAGLGFNDTSRGTEHLVFVDEAMRMILGNEDVDPAAVMQYWLARVHPDDRGNVQEQQQRLWSGESVQVSAEYRYNHPEHGWVWISHVARAVETDAHGRATRIIGVVRDITERELARHALEEQLAFETMLSEASSSLLATAPADLDREIERLLGEAARTLGAERAALLAVLPDGNGRVTHLWLGPGQAPVPANEEVAAGFPFLWSRHVVHRLPFAFSRLDELPEEAASDREMLVVMGVASGQGVPLPAGEPPRHVIVVNAATEGRACSAALTPRLRLLGEAFVAALDRRRATEALERSLAEIERLKSQLEAENRYLREEHSLRFGHGQITGESRAIIEVLQLVEQVAPSRATVLVEGETGVGKELVARRVHELSPRAGRPLVKVNCAALPSTLVESELFGRERGAFTGAVSREQGRFELADGSTIFLDEVGELPLELQAKLLRVLEEGEFERVGSPRTLHTDARVIAATNRDLEAEVKAGRFRRDLYYRLSAFPIRVPPLRERREDIPLLMWALIAEIGAGMHREITSVPRRTVEALKLQDWAGNVRELRNVIERAMIRSTGPTLEIELPGGVAHAQPDAGTSLDQAQRRHIAKVLEATGGRISGPGGAAELLNMKRTTLHSLMKRLGMAPRRGNGGRGA